MLRRRSLPSSASAKLKTSSLEVISQSVSSRRFQTQRQLVRGGGTSEYFVKSPKARRKAYFMLFWLFIYFQIFAPKRMDFMKKRFDNELDYYEDHDKKYGYQRSYAIGSQGKATVVQSPSSVETARPADATGAVTEPDGIASTSRMYRPQTWFGWYAKN